MSYMMRARPGSYSRVCDVCGRPRPIEAFRQVEGLFICSLHPGYIPARVLDKVPYVNIGPPEAPPNMKPFQPVDTYEAAEAEVFKFITNFAPYARFSLVSSPPVIPGAKGATVQAAAESVAYLYNIIAENTRPAIWIALARTKVLELADYIITQQVGGPFVSTYASSALEWGAFPYESGATEYRAEICGQAGIALLRAYQLSGRDKYVAAARATAWFTRTAQCGDMIASCPSSSDAAGSSLKHWGAWSDRAKQYLGAVAFDHHYTAGTLSCLEFLVLYKALVGDETIGSPTTTADFLRSRECTVSASIAEAVAFWKTGAPDSVVGGVVNGLSTSAPRGFYQSYPTTNTGYANGTGAWAFLTSGDAATGTDITSYYIGVALRAFIAYEGVSSFVTDIFDWLMTFTSNPTYELPAKYDERYRYTNVLGTYDPTIAPAHLLRVRDATTLAATKTNGGGYYDLRALGMMAQLYSARQPAGFKSAKLKFSTPIPQYAGGVDVGRRIWPATMDLVGMGLQSSGLCETYGSAMAGNIYRYAPKASMGQGRAAAVAATTSAVGSGTPLTTTVTRTFAVTAAASCRWSGPDGNSNAWVIMRDGTGAVGSVVSSTLTVGFKSGLLAATWAQVYRFLATFNTSTFGSGSVVTSASLSVAFSVNSSPLVPAHDVNVYASSPASNTVIASSDIANVGAVPFATAISAADISASLVTHTFVLNAAGLTAINVTGYTRLSLRNANYDVANVEPTWPSASAFDNFSAATISAAAPVLTVTAEVPV